MVFVRDFFGIIHCPRFWLSFSVFFLERVFSARFWRFLCQNLQNLASRTPFRLFRTALWCSTHLDLSLAYPSIIQFHGMIAASLRSVRGGGLLRAAVLRSRQAPLACLGGAAHRTRQNPLFEIATWLLSLVPEIFGRELVLETFSIPSFAKNPAPSANYAVWKKEKPCPDRGNNTFSILALLRNIFKKYHNAEKRQNE
jgi:hypothetical protein